MDTHPRQGLRPGKGRSSKTIPSRRKEKWAPHCTSMGSLGAAAPKRPFRPFWAAPKGPRARGRETSPAGTVRKTRWGRNPLEGPAPPLPVKAASRQPQLIPRPPGPIRSDPLVGNPEACKLRPSCPDESQFRPAATAAKCFLRSVFLDVSDNWYIPLFSIHSKCRLYIESSLSCSGIHSNKSPG